MSGPGKALLGVGALALGWLGIELLTGTTAEPEENPHISEDSDDSETNSEYSRKRAERKERKRAKRKERKKRERERERERQREMERQRELERKKYEAHSEESESESESDAESDGSIGEQAPSEHEPQEAKVLKAPDFSTVSSATPIPQVNVPEPVMSSEPVPTLAPVQPVSERKSVREESGPFDLISTNSAAEYRKRPKRASPERTIRI